MSRFAMIPQTSSLLWCDEVEYVIYVLGVTTSMRYEYRWRDGDAKETASSWQKWTDDEVDGDVQYVKNE